MNQPRIARAMLRALSALNMSQTDLAERSGLAKSTITHILKGRRPTPEILKAVVMHWPDAESGLEVLAAHLRDEIDHAGGQHDKITIGTGKPHDISLADAFREIEAEAAISPSTRDLVLDLAQLLREFHARPYSDAAGAAEVPQEDAPHAPPAKPIRYPSGNRRSSPRRPD